MGAIARNFGDKCERTKMGDGQKSSSPKRPGRWGEEIKVVVCKFTS